MTSRDPRWLLLIHAIPPKPDALRARVGRRLARVGAVPIKNSVYLLPNSDERREDLEWIRREVDQGGGECTILTAGFVGGLTDEEAEHLFRRARDVDYEALRADLQRLAAASTSPDDTANDTVAADLSRLRKRFEAIQAIDFFSAPQRADAEQALGRLAASIRTRDEGAVRPAPAPAVRGATWVTRRDVHVDRLASAWLIRRFIDPEARFRFVVPEEYVHAAGELRFDMFDGEFTHEQGGCTFETLCRRFALTDPALAALGELVHDLDLKDGGFGRPEGAGIALVIEGLARTHPDDEERVRHAEPLFDAVHAALSTPPRE